MFDRGRYAWNKGGVESTANLTAIHLETSQIDKQVKGHFFLADNDTAQWLNLLLSLI